MQDRASLLRAAAYTTASWIRARRAIWEGATATVSRTAVAAPTLAFPVHKADTPAVTNKKVGAGGPSAH
jgi:hypothetical protein